MKQNSSPTRREIPQNAYAFPTHKPSRPSAEVIAEVFPSELPTPP